MNAVWNVNTRVPTKVVLNYVRSQFRSDDGVWVYTYIPPKEK